MMTGLIYDWSGVGLDVRVDGQSKGSWKRTRLDRRKGFMMKVCLAVGWLG